jgi:hypothetical protein
MTAQMHDSILLEDQKFSIVGVNGTDLFQPAAFQMNPYMTVTSCWRGFVCEYKIESNKLFLNTLQINVDGQAPRINGANPLVSKGMLNNVYNHLNLPMDFTGEILAGDQFIRELYMHMGFQPAWKFEIVHQLMISHGTVLDTKDISPEMRRVREGMSRPPKPEWRSR